MSNIAANDLKTKGISVVERALREEGEAVITVRGKQKYVVLDFESYNKLREYELDVALMEARADLEASRYCTESVEEHMKRLSD